MLVAWVFIVDPLISAHAKFKCILIGQATWNLCKVYIVSPYGSYLDIQGLICTHTHTHTHTIEVVAKLVCWICHSRSIPLLSSVLWDCRKIGLLICATHLLTAVMVYQQITNCRSCVGEVEVLKCKLRALGSGFVALTSFQIAWETFSNLLPFNNMEVNWTHMHQFYWPFKCAWIPRFFWEWMCMHKQWILDCFLSSLMAWEWGWT